MTGSSEDPLQPLLREAEAELSRRLHEACEAEERGITTESAAEIRRLEDALLAAAMAAEQTVALRRHLQRRGSRSGEAADEPERRQQGGVEMQPGNVETARPAGVREFRDRRGKQWRAWPVTPGAARSGRAKHFLGDFRLGWVCFEGLDCAARRRLPGHPAGWTDLSDAELEKLLQRAIEVRERKAADRAATTGADDRP